MKNYTIIIFTLVLLAAVGVSALYLKNQLIDDDGDVVVITEEQTSDELEISMPGVEEEVEDIPYEETEEGKAEIERLGFEEYDNVKLRPDITSITTEEIAENQKTLKEYVAEAEITYDPNYALDSDNVSDSLSWMDMMNNATYAAVSSMLAQYCEKYNMDPSGFVCDDPIEDIEIEPGVFAVYVYNDTVKLTIASDYDVETGKLFGGIIAEEKLQ